MINNKPVKMEGDWDCRALSDIFFKRLQKGKLKPFVDLVKKPGSKLELVLRGNNYQDKKPLTGGEAVIYMNNHAMFKIHPQSVEINPNYLRYDPDWEKDLEKLKNEFFFKEIPTMGEVRQNKGVYSRSFEKDHMTAAITPEFLDKLDDLCYFWTNVFVGFFDKKGHQIDQFLENAKNDEAYKDKDLQKTKKVELEKIRQQQLYSSMCNTCDGYYFYDMEFQQKHKCEKHAKKDKEKGLSNNPDMQALRFDKNGKPVAWVMVEVKSRKGAFEGSAGLKKHIDSMKKYIKCDDYVNNRRREAYLLFIQYKKLGLLKGNVNIDADLFDKLVPEIILVFTDKEAVTKWNNFKGNIVGEYREETVLGDMVLVRGIEGVEIRDKLNG